MVPLPKANMCKHMCKIGKIVYNNSMLNVSSKAGTNFCIYKNNLEGTESSGSAWQVNKIKNSVTGRIKAQSAVKDGLSSHENKKRKAGTLHSHVSAVDPEACME